MLTGGLDLVKQTRARSSTWEFGLGKSVVSTEVPSVYCNFSIINRNRQVDRTKEIRKVNNNKALRFLYTNATSLVNKWDDFISLIHFNDFPHIIMVTETWFNCKSIKKVPNYTLFNKDRSQIRGGGVAIYVRMDVESIDIYEGGLSDVVGEQIWCKIVVGSESLLLGCIYRPPFSNFEVMEEICSSIKKKIRLQR